MALQNQVKTGLSPSELLLSQLDNIETPQNGIIRQTKKKLAQVTTAVALGGVLSGTPALAEYKPVYKQLASNEVMLVAENILTQEQFFADAQLNDNRKGYFNGFNEDLKSNILKYYTQGLEDSPGIDSKGKKILGGYLVSYYDSLNNTKEYIREVSNGNFSYEYKGGGNLDSDGKKIEKYLTRYGNRFSIPGKQIDDMMLKILSERSTQLSEEINSLDKLINSLDKLNQSL